MEREQGIQPDSLSPREQLERLLGNRQTLNAVVEALEGQGV